MVQWAWNFREFEQNLVAERERHSDEVTWLKETHESHENFLMKRHKAELARLAKVEMFKDVLECIGFDFDTEVEKVSIGSNEGFVCCQHVDVQYVADGETKSMHIVSVDTSGAKVEAYQ